MPLYSRFVLMVVLALMLASCAAQRAFNQGNKLMAAGKQDEALVKLEEAARLRPGSAEYRIAFLSQRGSRIAQLLLAGETQRREGQLTEAEKTYQHVLQLDSAQALARQGLQAIVTERRHRQLVLKAEERLKNEGDGAMPELHLLVDRVLAENPVQRDALNFKTRLQERSKQQRAMPAELADGFRKPISISFRDAPLRTVFDVISEVSGLNFVFDKDMRPDLKASIQVKNTSIDEVVRILLFTNQLEYRVLSRNSLLIYPSNPQKQKDYRNLEVRTFYLANAEAKTVAGTLKTILKSADMVVDERLNLIIVRDTSDAIRVAERLVTLQDIADPEVMLEVEILEIKRSRLMELGISWPDQGSLTPLPSAGTVLTLADLRDLQPRRIQATTGSAFINLRKDDQDGNILANPRIRVRNKEKAKIMIGDRVPVITTTSTSTGFVSETVSYVDVGLRLEVEPNIYLDEEVGIKINLEVSNLVREVTSKSGTLAYQIGTRNANTVLRLRDGETQILAGLISNEERSNADKVPGLGELPILGRLFGSQKDDRQRSEIVLSITPRLVRSIRRPDIDAASFEAGTENQVGMPPLLLKGEEPPEPPSEPSRANAPTPVVPSAVLPPDEALMPATTPAAAQTPGAANAARVKLKWVAPGQVKIGEVFAVSLELDSPGPIQGLPFVIQYDPAFLQLLTLEEGEFFKQRGAVTRFSQRVDSQQGKAYVTVLRQPSGINGRGSVAKLAFRSLRAGDSAISLLSASPDPTTLLVGELPVAGIKGVR
ncbi:MAG: putative secretion system protein GspD-like [Moraxellaceae bacterium]|jgi:general secretion pathway protein D|nr:putative secretion system protein GspD-like [Moraxellaceae bacterium]